MKHRNRVIAFRKDILSLKRYKLIELSKIFNSDSVLARLLPELHVQKYFENAMRSHKVFKQLRVAWKLFQYPIPLKKDQYDYDENFGTQRSPFGIGS